jgi:hypothetical protein
MKIHPIFVILLFFYISCSSTYYVKNEDSSYNHINKKLKGENATVTLVNKQELVGKNIEVKFDSTSVEKINIHTKDIKEITIKNHDWGVIKGTGLGVLVGAAMGGMIYVTTTTNKPMGFGLVLIALPVLGLFSGALIGGIVGDIETFVFPSNKMESEPTNRVEFTKIVEKGRGYIVILWQGKKIRLLRAEYNYMVESDDGKQFIIIPEEVYLEKFQ